MRFCLVGVVSLALAPALSLAEPRPYLLRAVSEDQMLGLMKRQMAGYSPSSTFCAEGDTCADACGPTFVQCPSSDNNIHCFDPASKQVCCTDGSGLPCDDGFYCTKDNAGGTWCCPNELDLAACAAVFTVSGSLSSVSAITGAGEITTSTLTVSSTSTTSVLSVGSTTSTITKTATSTSNAAVGPATSKVTSTTSIKPASNSTVSTISATFSGAANAPVAGGFALPLAIAGALAAL